MVQCASENTMKCNCGKQEAWQSSDFRVDRKALWRKGSGWGGLPSRDLPPRFGKEGLDLRNISICGKKIIFSCRTDKNINKRGLSKLCRIFTILLRDSSQPLACFNQTKLVFMLYQKISLTPHPDWVFFVWNTLAEYVWVRTHFKM